MALGIEDDVVEQPVFEQSEKGINIKSGSWVSVAKVDRCGQPATRRLFVKFLPDQNRFEVHPLTPGDFRGNLKLEASGDATNQGWSEIWKAQACGKAVSATVTYQAIPGGMNIDAQNLKIESPPDSPDYGVRCRNGPGS